MIALAASFALLFASPQDACAPRDTACQISRLEGRIAALEQRLARPPEPASPIGTVELESNFVCANTTACARAAREACEQAGFTRGVPKTSIPSTAPGIWVMRVTCTG